MISVLFCGIISAIFSVDSSALQSSQNASVFDNSKVNGNFDAEPLIDPGSGSSPQNEITYLDDENQIIQVDFIQSTGGECIDTGYYANLDITIKMGIICYDDSANQFLGNDGAYNEFNIMYYVGDFFWAVGGTRVRGGGDNLGQYTDLEVGNYPNCYIKQDGHLIASANKSTGNVPSSTIKAPVSNKSSRVRFYYLEIYDAEVLVRDLVPCYNNAINSATGEKFGFGFFDKVESRFYENSGTGKFISNYHDPDLEYEICDYEQYFIDNDLTQSSTTTITGTGAENDPYIINSSKDFWWASKYLDCSNKFVELGCDIILNEEKYDEDGNIVPGTSADGRVYCYTSGFSSSNESFDGKNHKVYGWYSLNPISTASLLGQVKRVENLSIDDFYIESNNRYISVCGICITSATIINNCHTLRGVFRGSPTILNISLCAIGSAEQYISNCTNHANIYYPWQGSSVIGNCSNGTIENCTNYGDVVQGGAYVSSIGKAKKYINCVNYGNIASNYSGGISTTHGDCVLVGCKNFGKTSNYSGGLIGGFNPGAITVVFRNCEVDCQGAGDALFGGLRHGTETTIIENCKIKLYGSQRIIYNSSKDSYISNCEIEYVDYVGNMMFNVCTTNTKIKAKKKTSWSSNRLILCQNSKDANLKNIYIETDYDLKNSFLFNTKNGDPKCLDGIIVKTPNSKYFYGNDFSAYHVDWKTGALGQNWATSVGFFQARVDVATLEKMGYTKQTY